MKSLTLLSAIGLLSLSSCGTPAGSTGAGARDGYFFSGSARTSGPMHWQKREKFRLNGSSSASSDPILSELTAEDIANIKAMRKNNN